MQVTHRAMDFSANAYLTVHIIKGGLEGFLLLGGHAVDCIAVILLDLVFTDFTNREDACKRQRLFETM